MTEDNKNQLIAYTDGSYLWKNKTAGIGVYFVNHEDWNISRPLDHPRTNQRAELAACIAAIEVARAKNKRNMKICTDSSYVINCINLYIPKWKNNGWKTLRGTSVKNQDLIVVLDELSNNLVVEWQHVKGHKDEGNKKADKLAKEGATQCVD